MTFKSLKKYRKIYIFTVSSKKLGSGHLKRSMVIKDYLKKKGIQCKILLFGETREQNFHFQTNSNPLSTFIDTYKKIILKHDNFIILDCSNSKIMKKNFIIQIKKYSTNHQNKIFIIDSLHKDNLISKIQLTKISFMLPYFTEKKYLFKFRKFKKKLIGPKYFIFNKYFKNIKNKEIKKINNILITFGASDLFNATLKILKKIMDNFKSSKITIVIGPYFSKNLIVKIKNFANKENDITCIDYSSNIIKLINDNDLLVTNSGLTKYEFCLSNKRVLIYSENKSNQSINLPFNKKNLCYHYSYLEKDKKMSKIMFNSKYNIMNKNRKKVLDTKGLDRIFSYLKNQLTY